MTNSNTYSIKMVILFVAISVCLASSSAQAASRESGDPQLDPVTIIKPRFRHIDQSEPEYSHLLRMKRDTGCIPSGNDCPKGSTDCCNNGDCSCVLMIGNDPSTSFESCKCSTKGTPRQSSVLDDQLIGQERKNKKSCIKGGDTCYRALITKKGSKRNCCPGHTCECKETLKKGKFSKRSQNCSCVATPEGDPLSAR